MYAAFDKDTMLRARKALEKFKSVSPMLTSFARAVSGNPRIRVVAGASTETDGKVIRICPPITMADTYAHQRNLCYRRDPVTHEYECQACRGWDDTLMSVLHELSHIVYGGVGTEDGIEALVKGRKMYARRAVELGAELAGPNTPLRSKDANEVYAAIDKLEPYLLIMHNALDDARIDAAMMRERPGLKKSHDVRYRLMADREFILVDDKGEARTVDWSELQGDMQALMSIYLTAAGFEVPEYIDEEARNLVADPDMVKILEGVTDLASTESAMEACADVLHIARQHGFFSLKREEPDESEESEDGEEGGENSGEGSGEASGEGGSGGPGGPNGDGGSEEDGDTLEEHLKKLQDLIDQMTGHQTSQDNRNHGPEGSSQVIKNERSGAGLTNGGSDDEEHMAAAILQDGHFDNPALEVTGVVMDEFQDVWNPGIHPISHPSESIMAPALARLREILAPNRRSQTTRHLKSGKVNAKVLGKRAKVGDDRLFKKKRVEDKRDFYVLIGLDVSGSTAGKNIELIKASVAAQGELLHRLGIPFEIYAHSTKLLAESTGSYSHCVQLIRVKSKEESWSKEIRRRVNGIQPVAGNFDGYVMESFRHIAERSGARERIIIQYSDGLFPIGNAEEEEEFIQREIKVRAQDPNMHFMMVGVSTNSPAKYGFNFVRIDSLSDTRLIVDQLESTVGATRR